MRVAYGKKTKKLSSSARSPCPPRRQSKMRAKAMIDNHDPIKTVPIGTTRSSDKTTSASSAPSLTQATFHDEQNYEEFLNDQLYKTTAEFNDIFTLQSNKSSVAERDLQHRLVVTITRSRHPDPLAL